jgi:hypothetical protein
MKDNIPSYEESKNIKLGLKNKDITEKELCDFNEVRKYSKLDYNRLTKNIKGKKLNIMCPFCRIKRLIGMLIPGVGLLQQSCEGCLNSAVEKRKNLLKEMQK